LRVESHAGNGEVAIHTTIFTADYVSRAENLAALCYEEERMHVPILPQMISIPDLSAYAAEQRGVVAIAGDTLLGFLCWEKPRKPFFGDCLGAWTPVHAHGAIGENRREIYDYLYQHMAEMHVKERIMTHAVTFYAHHADGIDIFFNNGFGMRCIDAIRTTEGIGSKRSDGVSLRHAEIGDASAIAEMNNALVDHLNKSPLFMAYYGHFSPEDILHGMSEGKYQYMVALRGDRLVSYLRLQETGENFAADDARVWNISGAYTITSERGSGVSTALLDWTLLHLRDEGYSLCGVDYESINPTARRFWQKYFTPYTYSLVRRIDERIRS